MSRPVFDYQAPEPLPLFDGIAALAAKDEALDAHEERQSGWLQRARAAAWRIAKSRGTVTADDVRHEVGDPPSPNVMGALFRSSEFTWTGHWQRSELVRGKGNMQRVWRVAG